MIIRHVKVLNEGSNYWNPNGYAIKAKLFYLDRCVATGYILSYSIECSDENSSYKFESK